MDTKQNTLASEVASRDNVVREDNSHPEHLQNRSSAEIKQRIDRTRGAMDSTLNQLGERLSPHSLLDDAMEWFKSSSAQNSAHQLKSNVQILGKNLGCQVRDNPLPALLVGAGLAWMAFGSTSDQTEEEEDELSYAEDQGFTTEEELLIGGYGTAARSRPDSGSSSGPAGLYLPSSALESGQESSMVSKAKHSGSKVASSLQHAASSTVHSLHDAAETVGEKISEATAAAARGVREAASSVGSAVSSAGEATQSAAHRGYSNTRAATRSAYRGSARSSQRVGRKFQQVGRRSSEQLTETYAVAREKFREAHEDYPLALGFGFLALGALAGLAIPRTRQEDELLGEAADQFRDSAWEAGEEAVVRGQETVAETLNTARTSAEAQGLTPDNLANSASRVWEKTAATLNQASKEEGVHPQQLSEKSKDVVDKTKETVKREITK